MARKTNPKPATRSAATASSGSGGAARATVRMYRQGLGDCFLITLTRKSRSPYRILIDCGVILGTPDSTTIMTQVVDDIVSQSAGHLDLLLATHQHWDHLSGFIQAKSSFAKLTIDEVWVAWTEDPKDDLAQQLRGERTQALNALRLAGVAMTLAGDDAGAAEVDDLTSFFGAAGSASTQDALDEAMKKGAIRYCRPSDPPLHLVDPNVRLYILGPPHDPKLIRQTLPSARDPETYGLAARMPTANVIAALSDTDDCAPFDAIRSVPYSNALGIPFFQQRYWGPADEASEWRRIDTAWLAGASDLALALDSATNNTSLVLAIEFVDSQEVLLFVADAQVGNWLSWQDLTWEVDGAKVTGPDLLARTVFYKVGHHGSHNATLREKGLEQMRKLHTAAIPVNHEMAVKKRWGNMPLPTLVEALKKVTNGRVIRIDEDPATPIPGVTVTPLYFDISM